MPRAPREKIPVEVRTEPEGVEDVEDITEIEELADWIKETVPKLKDDDGGLLTITAKEKTPYGTVGSFTDVIAQVEIEGMESPDALAEKIYTIAARDAEAQDGGTYMITLAGVPSRFPLMFPSTQGERSNERGMVPYEGGMSRYGQGPAGPMGPMGGRIPVEGWVNWAKLRDEHERFLYDASIRERADIFKLMKSTIQEQAETIRHYEKERAKERMMVDDLISTQKQRDLEIEQLRRKEERMDDMLGSLKPWIHGIAARFLGPGAVPKDIVPLLDQFESVFSTFTPEQLQKIMTSEVFSNQQKQGIVGLFDTLTNLREQMDKSKMSKHNGVSS